ncbi:MAG: hypothetical protein ACOCV7_02235, partial [Desulfonatronovibrionaceae bacterium]
LMETSAGSSAKDYEIVVEKNLFSPERKAWKPPEEKKEENAQPVSSAQRVNEREFRLYGVTFADEEKLALVYYQRLPENSRQRMVSEGQAVYSERDGGDQVFKVVSIEPESVTIEAGGDTFDVGLFSHARREVRSQPDGGMAISLGGAGQDSGQTVSTGQTVPGPGPTGSPPPDNPDSASAGQGGSEVSKGQDPDADSEDGQDSKPANLPELLKKMMEKSADKNKSGSNEDMEKKVQEGSMRRIDTPFGPIYRPNE